MGRLSRWNKWINKTFFESEFVPMVIILPFLCIFILFYLAVILEVYLRGASRVEKLSWPMFEVRHPALTKAVKILGVIFLPDVLAFIVIISLSGLDEKLKLWYLWEGDKYERY